MRKYYPYEAGAPSHDTIGRVLGLIDKKQFESLFTSWVAQHFEVSKEKLLHLDGKRLRGSATGQQKIKKREDGGKYAEIIINVYASGAGLALAHHNITDHLNEVQGALEVLDWLDIKGCCISGDSNFCKRVIIDKIVASKGDYLMALKGNNPKLHNAAQEVFSAPPTDVLRFETKESGHGRRENRIYSAVPMEQLPTELSSYFTKNEQLIEVKRKRHIISSGKESEEVHYYVTSLKEPIAELSHKIRKHWLIENQLHYVLDVHFNEDDSRVQQKNAATNLSLIRKMALNVLKHSLGKGAIKAKQLKCAISDQHREKVLTFFMMR